MFTAARLVAALCLMVLGWIGSDYVQQIWPQDMYFGNFNYINAAIGFLCGWIIVGPRAGRGFSPALSHGITGAVSLIFWALLLQSIRQMVHLALRHRYDSAMEAFAAIFQIAIDYAANLADPGFVILMVVGAGITAILTETASRHWR